MEGRCKFFDIEKFFGFVTSTDHGDVFFHGSALLFDPEELKMGDAVSFEIADCTGRHAGRLKAVDIQKRA